MGKQHGSLARAGKVKGATPCVPTADHTRKPCGRALKKIKFNKRFTDKGIKTSPNANGGQEKRT